VQSRTPSVQPGRLLALATEISQALIVGRDRMGLAWFYKRAAYNEINAAKDVFEQWDGNGSTN
jgi:hypothetical protein